METSDRAAGPYDCEMKEIAQAHSLSESGAKMSVQRGLRKLKVLLEVKNDTWY